MKKRLLSLFLALVMCFGLMPPTSVWAAPKKAAQTATTGQNLYGTPTTYQPVRELYRQKADKEPVKLFDGTASTWTQYLKELEHAKQAASGSKSISWLKTNDYLLNRFLVYDREWSGGSFPYDDLPTNFFNVKKGERNLIWHEDGLRPSDYEIKNPAGYWEIDLAKLGNIANMLQKNDLQYKFSCVCTNVEWTYWEGLTKMKNADHIRWFTPGEEYTQDVHNPGTHGFHAEDDGRPLIVGEGKDEANWVEAERFEKLTLQHIFVNSGAGISNAVVVGRDVNGPLVKNAWASYDPEGKRPIEGMLNLEELGKLPGRKIYFHLRFDEPVILRDRIPNPNDKEDTKGLPRDMSRADIDRLVLNVSTLGKDNTPAIEAAAPFLHFAPDTMDPTPVMTFEYQIPDAYNVPAGMTDEEAGVLKERGKWFRFDAIKIDTSMNKELFQHVEDLAGNQYGAKLGVTDADRRQTTETKLEGRPGVDLEPFHIEDIRMYVDPQPSGSEGGFIPRGAALGVRLYLSDPINLQQFQGDVYSFCPTVTLNLLDENGKQIVLGAVPKQQTVSRLDYRRGDSGVMEWQPGGVLMGNWDIQDNHNTGDYLYSMNVPKRIQLTSDPELKNEDGVYPYTCDFVEYNMQLVPGKAMLPPGEKTVRIVAVTGRGTNHLRNLNGNELMDYHEIAAGKSKILEPVALPNGLEIRDAAEKALVLKENRRGQDKQYVMDFIPPKAQIVMRPTAEKNVLEVELTAEDDHVANSTVSYQLSIEYPPYEEKVQYQATTSAGYDGKLWKPFDHLHPGFKAPLGPVSGTKQGKSYVYIMFPKGSDVTKVSVHAVVRDEPGNTTALDTQLDKTTGWKGIDTMAPWVTLETDPANSEVPILQMRDMMSAEGMKYRYAWVEQGAAAPLESVYSEWLPYQDRRNSTIPPPDDMPQAVEGKLVYNRTLYVQGMDGSGNLSEKVMANYAFDRSRLEVSLKKTDPLHVELVMKNVQDAKNFWHVWMEKPTNFIIPNEDGTVTDYGGVVPYLYALRDSYIPTVPADTVQNMGCLEQYAREQFYNGFRDDELNIKLESTIQYKHQIFFDEVDRLPPATAPYMVDATRVGNDVTARISIAPGEPTSERGVGAICIPFDDFNPQLGDMGIWKWVDTAHKDTSRPFHSTYGQTKVRDVKRPLILLVGIRMNDGSTMLQSLEFDPTGISEFDDPAAEMVRFSTNDRNGNRLDHNLPLLRYPEYGSEEDLLYSDVYDFAEAEFYFTGDPTKGISHYDLHSSRVQLVRETSVGYYEEKDQLVQEWPLDQLTITQISRGTYEDNSKRRGWPNGWPMSPSTSNEPIYSAILNFDPAILRQGLLDLRPEEDQGQSGIDSEFTSVKYFFKMEMWSPEWDDGSNTPPVVGELDEYAGESFQKFMVDNSAPKGAVRRPGQDAQVMTPVELIRLNGSDATSSVPICLLPGSEGSLEFVMDEIIAPIVHRRHREESVQAQAEGGETAPEILAMVGQYASMEDVNCTAEPGRARGFGPAVRAGIRPDAMTLTGRFQQNPYTEDYMYDGYAPVVLDVSSLLHEQETTRIYYQFYDVYRGCESAVYVVDVRKDTTPPVAGLAVSETTAPRREVTVRADALYDGHTEKGVFIVDTPEWEIVGDVHAKQWTTAQDGTRTLTDLLPDENGVYHFTANGYVERTAVDKAGNALKKLTVNGQAYVTPASPDPAYGTAKGPRYYVTNVDQNPPKFVQGPTWTVDEAAGSVTITAQVEDAAAVYLRFDDAYQTAITPEGTTQAAAKEPVNLAGNAPGIWNYSLKENGELKVTVYVKPDAKLSTAAMILEDRAGNRVESPENSFTNLTGVKPHVTNTATADSNQLPTYKNGGELSFSAPVYLSDYDRSAAVSHSELPIYMDGAMNVSYMDLFGTSYQETIYADIFGPAFSHKLIFRLPDGSVIASNEFTNQDLTIQVDCSSNPEVEVVGLDRFTLSENGKIFYTLRHKTLGQMTATLPIYNIDKTAPVANISTEFLQAESGGENRIYGVIYQVIGYNEDGVVLVPNQDGSKQSSRVTIDAQSAEKTHTFTFKDRAGNIGTAEVDARDIPFSRMDDSKLAGTRLVYHTANGRLLDADQALLANDDILITVEGLNAKGEVVPTQAEAVGKVPAGVQVVGAQSSVLFTGESDAERTVELTLTDNFTKTKKNVTITLPGGSIDKTLPTGRAEFEIQPDNSIRIYLQVTCDDLAENGVGIDGTVQGTEPLELKQDTDGRYYVTFERNGSVRFVLIDRAGNVGNVAAAVDDIDRDPAYVSRENWQTGAEYADTRELIDGLLQQYTNNSIFVFLSFNEQIARAQVKAFADKAEPLQELTPTEDYVAAAVSGNLLTLEFKQNCQAQIKVYDHWNNETVLWRPEDGPIAVIDRQPPTFTEGQGTYDAERNLWLLPYTFDEPVLLNSQVFLAKNDAPETLAAGDLYADYRTSWTVELDQNGKHALTFLDRAGNVVSAYPTVKQVDEDGPELWVGTDIAENSQKAQAADGTRYTDGSILVCLKAEDQTMDGLTFTAAALPQAGKTAGPGAEIPVEKKQTTLTVTVEDPAHPGQTKQETITYTHCFQVDENGTYQISAVDKWGHKTTIRADVNLIDRAAPSLVFTSSKTPRVSRNTAPEALESAALQGVEAKDASGLEVTLTTDVSQVDPTKAGTYPVTITAEDALGNRVSRTRSVAVLSGENREFKVRVPGGTTPEIVQSNDVLTVKAGQIAVDINAESFRNEGTNLTWAKGYKTAAQMKNGNEIALGGSFPVTDGYYTVLAQCADRQTFLMYLYVVE